MIDLSRYADAKLLLAGVGIVDAPYNLNQIRKPRVFFIALPVKIRRLTAFWTRAIALEEID
jgi:kynurenine formamidase